MAILQYSGFSWAATGALPILEGTSGMPATGADISSGGFHVNVTGANTASTAVIIPAASGLIVPGLTQDPIYLCFDMKILTLPSTLEEEFFAISSAAGATMAFFTVHTSGVIKVYSATGPTLRGTGTTVLEVGKWYRIDIDYNKSTSIVSVRIDGVADSGLTSIAGVASASAAGGLSVGKSTNRNSKECNAVYKNAIVSSTAIPTDAYVQFFWPMDIETASSWAKSSGTGAVYTYLNTSPPDGDTLYMSLDLNDALSAGKTVRSSIGSYTPERITKTPYAMKAGMVRRVNPGVNTSTFKIGLGTVETTAAQWSTAYLPAEKISTVDSGGSPWTVASARTVSWIVTCVTVNLAAGYTARCTALYGVALSSGKPPLNDPDQVPYISVVGNGAGMDRSVANYTLLEAINIISFRVGNLGPIDTLSNPGLAVGQIIQTCNEVLRKMNQVKPIPMTNGYIIIPLIPAYKDGTVAMTQGSKAVVGTGTVWTAAMAGRAFSTETTNYVYRIASVTDATNLVLDEAWVGDSSTTDSYVIAQDRYSLPNDFYDFSSVMLEGPRNKVLGTKFPSAIDFYRYMAQNKGMELGAPTSVTIWQQDSNGNWQLETDFFPGTVDSNGTYRIRIRYNRIMDRLKNDGDIIPVADENIFTFIRGCVANWLEMTGGEGSQGLFNKWIFEDLAFMAAFDHRTTDEEVRLVPQDVMRTSPLRNSFGGI